MCEVTSGYGKGCDSVGGVKTWYWFSLRDSAGESNYATEPTIVDGAVTAIALKAGKYAYPLNVEMETSSFQDTRIGERTNSAYARSQTATIILHGNTASMIDQLETGAKGRVVMIAEMNDGTYELAFMTNGGMIVDDRTTGTAMEDLNGNTLTITGKEFRKAPKISSVLVQALLEPAS
jgi:hypothetical protein